MRPDGNNSCVDFDYKKPEKMTREQKIQLHELLTMFIDETKGEIKPYELCKTKLDLAASYQASNLVDGAEKIKEVLCFAF